MMGVFDAPEALTPIGERSTTTVAPQALMLMNNPQVREYARALSRRAPDVRTAYRITLGRDPTEAESRDADAFIADQAAAYQSAGRADARALAVEDFCQSLMCLNEFVYVD
jgi:hypothetical protein